jgi:hypothetical protein
VIAGAEKMADSERNDPSLFSQPGSELADIFFEIINKNYSPENVSMSETFEYIELCWKLMPFRAKKKLRGFPNELKKRWCRQRFFRAQANREMSIVRSSMWSAIRYDPSMLGNIGVWSIIIEAVFGTSVIRWMRRVGLLIKTKKLIVF